MNGDITKSVQYDVSDCTIHACLHAGKSTPQRSSTNIATDKLLIYKCYIPASTKEQQEWISGHLKSWVQKSIMDGDRPSSTEKLWDGYIATDSFKSRYNHDCSIWVSDCSTRVPWSLKPWAIICESNSTPKCLLHWIEFCMHVHLNKSNGQN